MAAKADFLELTDDTLNANYPIPVPELAHIDKIDVNVVTREVFVGDEIDEAFGPWFTKVMQYLSRDDSQHSQSGITIWLNTPGGDETSMFAFHDAVRAVECPVTTIGTGQVCSAGVLMLACGDIRMVTESCVLMSHRGKGGMEGDYETLKARLEYVKWSEQQWARLMDRYTPKEVSGCRRAYSYWFQLGKKTSEWWQFGADAIIREGIADLIYPGSGFGYAAESGTLRSNKRDFTYKE